MSFLIYTCDEYQLHEVCDELTPTFLDRDDLPEYYEAQKEQQVKSSKEGKPQWNQELASNSEADV